MRTEKQISAVVLFIMMVAVGVASADVKVGFTGIFSGPPSALGRDQYAGFMLALGQLGGELGSHDVQVFKKNDQLKPEVGIQILRELLQKDDVDVVVGLGYSSVTLAMRPLLAKSGIPAIATNNGSPVLAGKGCEPNIFSVGWQNNAVAQAAGKVAQKRGYGSVYLMAPNYHGGKDMLKGFLHSYQGDVADEVYTRLGQTQYAAEITQIQLAKPDALFVFYPGGMGVSFVKQLDRAGVLGKLPFLSIFTIDWTTLPAIQNAAVGALSVTPWSPALDNPANQQFVKAYKKKYGRMPTEYAAAGYDAARLLDLAISRVGDDFSDHDALTRAIKAAGDDFKSVHGSFAFNVNNMPIENYYLVRFVANGGNVKQKIVGIPLKKYKDTFYKSCYMYDKSAP